MSEEIHSSNPKISDSNWNILSTSHSNVTTKWKALEDGSVMLSDWKTISPEKYLSYLLHIMIQYDSSDIYFTYWEEPAIRIYGEVYRLTTVPKLEDSTLEAISDILMSDEDKDRLPLKYVAFLGKEE